MRNTLVALLIASCAACSKEGAGGGINAPSSGSSSSVTSADLAFCVQETNRYRALVGVAAVTQSSDLEAYALAAARADHASNVPHGYTNGPNRPTGAFAENEALRWPQTTTIRAMIEGALAAFWREGPGGGHYENMRGPWRLVGCGVYAEGRAVTIVQHFR